MSSPLKIEFPSQGWKQILTSRNEILDAYDRARDKARSHEIETYHGKVAEASIRKWLSDFLPIRYGVTAGYVVSPGLPSSARTPHFDVIIYDKLESPVLWVEDDPDSSAAGRALAVPVEFVQAVFEVKAKLTAQTARASIEHLGDLSPIMQGLDDPAERYKLHLPPTFVCGSIFVELPSDVARSTSVLPAFLDGVGLRGYFGGMVLRAEDHTSGLTGRISLLRSEQPIERMPSGETAQLAEFGIAESRQVTSKFHLSVMIQWSEAGFAQCAFDILAMMRGTYEPGRLSSFYGMGNSFAEIIKPSSFEDLSKIVRDLSSVPNSLRPNER